MSFETKSVVDDYWKITTYQNFNSSDMNYDNFKNSLNSINSKTFEIIENINILVDFGINFTKKIIGFDQITKTFQGYIKSIENDSDLPSDDIIFTKKVTKGFFGKSVVGVSTFTRAPAGVIQFNEKNRKLFNLSTISLMINKGSFPLKYINEFNTNKLFILERTDGFRQDCIVNKNSSIFLFEHKTEQDGMRWRIQVTFNEQKHLNALERKNDAKNLQKIEMGDFTKTLFLKDFLDINNTDEITIDISNIKQSVNQSVNKESECGFYDFRYDSSDNEESSDDIENSIFVNFDLEPDIILNSYHEVIIENVVNYYLSRLDEYVICLKKCLEAEGIKVIIV